MKAIILRRPRCLELTDIPLPRLTEEHHVLVKVAACGICGSDLRYYAGENPWALHTLGRHIPNPPDMILGHELSGVVVQVNSARYEHLLGQRVGVQAFRTCGRCALCLSGHENLCRETLHIGHAQGWRDMPFYPGGYAEYCLAWADLLHPMAPHVAFEAEAMRDILGVGVHAVGRADLPAGGTALCIGGGPAGLSIAQVALARGAAHVLVSDPSPLARQIIGRHPGLAAVDPTQESLAAALRRVAGQAECHAVFDTVGSAATFEEALPLLAAAGTYVNLAVQSLSAPLDMQAIGSERRITTSSNAFYRDEREAHRLIETGAVDVVSMITHRLPLERYAEAFDLLLAGSREAYKVVFQMDEPT
ncbi:MAG: D-arabitol-phosphate dehydrogenase [Chloroflexi bacterium ADurb.Bin325]|nr:MAG: D-arabitol-phosphate dehydrogenase [Chloroflexi bacterium ADurb.Bin325]